MTAAGTVAAFDAERLECLWGDVPVEFRTWTYDLSCAPFDRALRGRRARVVVLPVDGLSETVRREIAWWVWWCQARSNRRVPVDIVQHLVAAVGHIDGKHPRRSLTCSLVDPEPAQLLRAFRQTYHDHYGRLPGPHLVRVFADEVRFLRFAFQLQYSPLEWWQHDVWSPRQDPRIPLRPHEPLGAQNLSFVNIEPVWLRESLKFYGRVSLETGELTWGTVMQRVFHVGSYLGGFVAARGLTGPALCEHPEDQLRALMLDYQSYLRGRRATRRGSQQALAPFTVRQAQISLQGFYFFLVDHRQEVAAATGDRRFLELGPAHLRLWRRSDLVTGRRRDNGSPPDAYIGDHDLGQMIEHVELLGMPATESKTVVREGTPVTVGGLGDPSGMRVWLLQALTGRRANEILMLDYNPLLAVPGLANDDTGDVVAKLRYQQTKIPGAPETILVGGDVVALIGEQQTWLRERLNLAPGDPDPPYLFPSLNRNPRGVRHRGLGGYHHALHRLSDSLMLVDRQGRRLQYAKSHRLRHTKATNLLNLGAPLHVVMRYMGHRSQAMTLHYAQTLAETAEREFLRTHKIGADGRDLEISPRDVYDLIALSDRTDRVLPTGVCLLPPAKRCDKGNACYGCGYFATDRTFLSEHQDLLEQSLALVVKRKQMHLDRTGREMTDDNIWLQEQNRTIDALRHIIATLQAQPDGDIQAIKGPGTRPSPGAQPVTVHVGDSAARRFHAAG